MGLGRQQGTDPRISPSFVLGSGRCGSSLIHETLCRHPDVAFVTNLEDKLRRRLPEGTARSFASNLHRRLPPRFTKKGRIRFAPSEAYNVLAAQVSPLLVDPCRDLVPSDVTPELRSRLVRFFSLPADSQQLLLHKFTGWPRALLLADIFPEARFVNVVRDGRDVASSWLRMPWWRGHLGPTGWHFGELDPQTDQIWKQSGESFVMLAALGWKIVMEASDKCRATLGDRWMDVRYEDICAAPGENFEKVLSHLGLGSHHGWPEVLERAGFRPPTPTASKTWPELGNEVAQVTRALAPWLEEFGYA